MTDSDAEYLGNHKANHLYTHPARSGAYAKIVGEREEVLGEIQVTDRCRLAIVAFYVQDKSDFASLKIKKIQYHARFGWREVESVELNHFHVAQMKEFLSIISGLDWSDAKKTRISLENINLNALATLIQSTNGRELIRELAVSSALTQDIYAVARK
jgi:hypothetical protein